MAKTILLHPQDTVEVLTEPDAETGLQVGHKLARQAIKAGEAIRKFGQIIGTATEDIAPGAHVHVQNCAFSDHDRSYQIGADLAQAEAMIPPGQGRQFMGYKRAKGRAGTRNYIALCATVNCSATVIRRAAEELTFEGVLEDYPNVDGITAFAHGSGCGMASSGHGPEMLERVLLGVASHPNVGAAMFVGLGCEVMQLARFKARIGDARFFGLTIQEAGGTRATIERIKAHLREILPVVNEATRVPCPVSDLRIGLQCGGSDGLSGITANPALGRASDLIVGEGGGVILSETPEIYGAEALLLRRATPEVAAQLLNCLQWWEGYAAEGGGSMDNNPSPGNKAGGITTILEKSLGAVAKAGATPLRAFYNYAEEVSSAGLSYMDTPGYDPVSATGQIAGGAQLIVFTTGRGSAFGSKPAPTLKLATSDRLLAQMPEDMDLGCGDVLSQGVNLADKGREIFELILATASGQKSKSETLDLGDNEFVPWQTGATM